MSVTALHPQYEQYKPTWIKMWDCYRGEDRIKECGQKYLPATSGMIADGMNGPGSGQYGDPGYEAYRAYLMRSVYHEYVTEAVEGFLGLMHKKSAVIQLPPELEPLRNNATVAGEPLLALLRSMNIEQLVTGRVGILADLPANSALGTLPYIALYGAGHIINWDDGTENNSRSNFNLVVLDETCVMRSNIFEWEERERYRVLYLGDGQAGVTTGTYHQRVLQEGDDFFSAAEVTPSFRGNELTTIPFVIANTKDIVAACDRPPLLGLANASLAVYRGEADYRQNLFMQGQDTLVIKGDLTPNSMDDNIRTGAGTYIKLDQAGDAKYIGVNSQGLSEQRLALQNDSKAAESRSAMLASPTSSQVESGDALEIRLAAQTATLQQIAQTAGYALEKLLKIIAVWVGADPNLVSVTPYTDFADLGMQGQDANYWMTAKRAGAPLSLQSIHARFVDRGLTNMDFETEMAAIKQEQQKYDFLIPAPAPTPTPQPTQQQNPNADPNLDKKPSNAPDSKT